MSTMEGTQVPTETSDGDAITVITSLAPATPIRVDVRTPPPLPRENEPENLPPSKALMMERYADRCRRWSSWPF